MRRTASALLIVAAFVLVTLSGCADDAKPATEDTLTVDEEVEVTDTTGAIRGVVVDAVISPIEGAKVVVRGQALETTTNENGEFAFSKVAPGAYFLDVSKPGYSTIQSSADVVAGEKTPPIVRVQLDRLPGSEPNSYVLKWQGTLGCSVRFIVNALSGCVVDLGDETQTRYTDFAATPTYVQSEMSWENTQQLGESLKLEYTDDSSGLDNYRIDQGGSPLVINADNGTLDSKHFDSVGLLVRIFTGSYMDTGLSLTLMQDFTVYTSVYENYAPPEDWRYMDSSELYPPPQ